MAMNRVDASSPPTVQDIADQAATLQRPHFPSIPGYEIQDELGRGGMGIVFLARQARLNRLVALKMILNARYCDDDSRRRFQVEAEAVARLQHPHIVQIYELGEHEGLPYFSLEYCGGGTLLSKLAGAQQAPHEAARLVRTLAGAVHAAHQQQIIHRDLKPANVLLTAQGDPKISDFGLVKKLDEQGQTGSGDVMGTPAYMAPEQASGRVRDIGPATDVYSLGAILYELLTGRPPFRAPTAMQTLDQVLRSEPTSVRQLRPDCPAELEAICLKCLQKQPAGRYASAAELADDLQRFEECRMVAILVLVISAGLLFSFGPPSFSGSRNATASAAPPGPPTAARQGNIEHGSQPVQTSSAPSGLMFATQVGPNGQAVDPGTRFPAKVKNLYAVFEPGKAPPGTRVNVDQPAKDAHYAYLKVKDDSPLSKVGWRWYRNNRVVNEYETQVQPGFEFWLQRFDYGEQGIFHDELGPGEYTVVILLGGNPALSTELQIDP
jgi:serine/threonine protein kinase